MSCFMRAWNGWVRVCLSINLFLQNTFAKWTDVVSRNPWKIIVTGILISLALMTGFMRFKELKHTERLYFPGSSRTKDDLARAEKSFPQKIKPDEWILTMGGDVNNESNVLNARALRFALETHKHIWAVSRSHESCYKPKSFNNTGNTDNNNNNFDSCLILSILELFNYNATLMINDEAIQRKIFDAHHNEKLIMSNGRPARLNLPTILGRISFNMTSQRAYASSMRFLYYMK